MDKRRNITAYLKKTGVPQICHLSTCHFEKVQTTSYNHTNVLETIKMFWIYLYFKILGSTVLFLDNLKKRTKEYCNLILNVKAKTKTEKRHLTKFHAYLFKKGLSFL